MKLYNLAEVEHRELGSEETREKFSISFSLAELFGFKNVCAFHDIVPPGRRSSLPHIHSEKEEMVLVLAGTPTLRLGDEVAVLKPGDFVGFRPGERPLHVIENHSGEDAAILVIASNPPDDQPIYV
ncbi:MAG TPA: cupin domain-containing protein [Fimbriimonadaceae bacterium]|nr:cupin domain-containing protein [Fimbriimonadaceae bacterium]